MKIAIDGPSASGKSTVAKLVAARLGYTYLDTGAMYRKVSAMALERDIPVSDVDGIIKMLRMHWHNIEIEDARLRSEEVNMTVSEVSSHGAVRDFLIGIQREFASGNDTVMDGRDIGTVVLPDAELKIYLDATAEVRASRRVLQSGRNFEEELESIRRRDFLDSTRKIGPLKKAEDAILVDTTDIGIDETVDLIVNLARKVAERQCSAKPMY